MVGTSQCSTRLPLSKLKHIALALNSGDSMRSFRASLRTVLESCLLYRPNSTPSSSDLKHNVACLDFLMPPTNATARLRRALILCLANGPWQIRGKVVHHCMECCTSREDCVGKFGAFFVGAVAGTNPRIWPQARWLGAEEAIGWIGVSQCINFLLEIVVCNWGSVRVGGPALNVAAVGMRMQTDRVSNCVRLDGWGLHEDPTANAGDENGAHDGKPGKVEEVDSEKRRKEQSRFRFSASEWFRHYYMDATAVLMLIAFVLRPLLALMQQRLEVAGDGFETRQSMQEAFSYMVDGADAGEVKERVHRHGLMAYLNVLEERCQRSALDMMQEEHHWIILPPHSRTAAFATWACIMLSSICSLCHDLMVYHRCYPWNMFGLLVDSSLEQEIMLDCKHLMDPWSRELLAKCHCEGLRLNDTTALSLSRQLGWKFAVIKRGLVGLSVQTHTVLFAHQGRLTQEVRRMSKHVRLGQKPPSLHKDRNSRPAKEQPQPQERQRRSSYGGAWRLFIRQQARGKRSSEVQPLAKLGQRYREQGDEERLGLQRKGQECTQRRMRGESFTFGETRRTQQMRAKKHLRDAMSQEKRA